MERGAAVFVLKMVERFGAEVISFANRDGGLQVSKDSFLRCRYPERSEGNLLKRNWQALTSQ